MKYHYKIWLCLMCFMLLCSVNRVFAIDYYRRHYIILVDNTTTSMNEDAEGLKEIGKMFENLFLNRDYYFGVNSQKINATETYLADLMFCPQTDEISVFKFGTTSDRSNIYDLDYGLNRIRHKVRNNSNELLSLTHEMIKPVAQFHKSNRDIETFLKDSLLPLFKGKGEGGVNMSSIIYPLVLSVVDTSLASAEYYIIVISNFKVRREQENSDDYGLIRTAMDQDSVHACNFSEQLWKLKSPFYTSELMKIQSLKNHNDTKNSMTRIRSIKAICYKLGVKSLQGVSAHVTSNIDLIQLEYGGCEFDLSPVSIAFAHDKNLEVNRIEVSITDDNGKVVYTSHISDAVFDSVEMKYRIPGRKLSFERTPDIGDKLMFNYVVYATPKDKDGNSLLPFVFPVEHDFEFGFDNFINLEKPSIFIKLMKIAVFLFVAAILVVLYVLIKRGKDNKRLVLELEHSNADEGTFQHVSREKGSLLLKCDYPKDGVTSITYTLQGHFEEQRRKAIPWYVNYIYVKASLKDSPDGMTVHPIDAKEGGWLPVIVKNNKVTIHLKVDFDECKEDVKYVKVWLQWCYEPRFVCYQNWPFKKHGIKAIRTESAFVKTFKEHEETFNNLLNQEDVKYSCGDGAFVIENFIRKPFEQPDLWVGIDPGTSGSCVTLGNGVMGNAGKPNIIRVTAQDTAGCEKSIINSLIVLGGKQFVPSNEISEWQPGRDYGYGIKAYERLEQYMSEGAYCFQSIKKLLGYKKGGADGRIKAIIGNKEHKFTGLDLQQLLVRALIKDVMTQYIIRLRTEPQLVQLRDNLFPNMNVDINAFERAVVTIPNNYQLPQILDMVESVRRNGFKEVKYIYEPEGILFHYLKETYNDHRKNETENIIVYDMGGATINATVFRVEIKMLDKQPQYHVSTLSRLGYAVGGDDVDYAIIEYLMHFAHIANIFSNDADRYLQQDENKTKLVNIAQRFKIALVQKAMQNMDQYDGSLDTIDQFVATYLSDIIRLFDSTKAFMCDDLSDSEKKRLTKSRQSFFDCLKQDLLASTWMKEYVFEKVKDAVLDMINTQDVRMSKKIDKIIFSGRTTLFPGIEDTVNTCLKENNLQPKKPYPLNGDLKSPVADGACWYGIYEGKIVFLDNSRVTSSYGFCLTQPGENPYVEMITQNSKYEENNMIERSKREESKFQSDAGHVNFYQVMGAHNNKDDDSLFNENNRHKVRFLTSINLGNSKAKEETIKVYANGIVKCDVDYDGKPEDQEEQTTEFDARDITKENARPYLFSVSNREKHKVNSASTSKGKITGKRF